MDIFRLITPATYWVLIVMWTLILLFYVRRIRLRQLQSRLIYTLIIILAIDAFRTLFESFYFGAWYTSLAGFIPKEVHTFLVRPEMVIIPKFLNVIAATIIIAILLRRWLPQEEFEANQLDSLIKERTSELVAVNKKLREEITEREQAEEELQKRRDENTRLAVIAEEQGELQDWVNTFDTFVGKFDPDGIGIIYNEAPLKAGGVTKDELAGKHFPDTKWWAHSEIERARIVECFKKAKAGSSSRIETNIRSADGTPVPIIFNCQPVMDADGKVNYITAEGKIITEEVKLRDALQKEKANLEKRVKERTSELVEANKKLREEIIERKRAEEALHKAHEGLEAKVAERTKELARANIQLKELDRLKSEFLATMSHELRTPLNSIIGFTGIILQDKAGKINNEQRKQLSMVYSSGKHLLSLINDILNLSRIESNKMEVSMDRFKIQDVVSEVSQSFSPMISQKGLKLIAEIPDTAPEIYSDRKKVLQILLNLTSNAVKFTETGEVRIECKFENDNLEVSVSDTGIGIKKENMGLLFETFRQVNGTVQRRYDGAGLGLHLCQKMVNLLGGEIRAESEYGRGSRFTFTLPVRLKKRGTT